MSSLGPLCPLCYAYEYEPALAEDAVVGLKVLETKDRKGHRRRIMVITKYHNPGVGFYREPSLNLLEKCGRKVFDYTYKFVLLDGVYGSLPDHPHYVATDLDPNSPDFAQILGTPWLRVIQVKKWKDRRASP